MSATVPESAIVIVDDDPIAVRLYEQALAPTGRPIVVAPGVAAAERIFAATSPALVVLDLVLPDGDGRSLLERMRQRPGTANTPVVVVSGTPGVEVKVHCYALGVQTYLEKPVAPELLAASVAGVLQRTATTRVDDRRDAVTGLPNRAAFAERFAEATAQASTAEPASVALLELDLPSADAADDDLLRRAAECFRGALRGDDLLARWGGASFVVLLPDTPPDDGARIVNGARRRLAGGTDATASAAVLPLAAGAVVDEVVDDLVSLVSLARTGAADAVATPATVAAAPRRDVLLADDEDLVAALVQHRLGREGFRVRRAADGPAALRMLQEAAPALLILDVMMPGIDGFELLERVRGDRRFARVPILMLTGLGRESDIARALRLGADDYVLKPFSPVELTARIHRLVARGA